MKQIIAETTEALYKATQMIAEEYENEYPELMRSHKISVHIQERGTLSFCLVPKDGGTCIHHKNFDFWGNKI